MLAHGVHAEALEVVDGGAEPDRFGDRRRAGLELPRELVGREPLLGDVEDHLAAGEERRRGLEHLGGAPEHADAGGAAHLVAGEGDEVGAPGLHVGGEVGDVLRGVDHRDGAGVVGGAHQPVDREQRAEHVRHGREGDDLGAVDQPVEVGEVEVAVGPDRDPAQLDAQLVVELVPGDDVGVVLELGEHDRVAGLEVGSAPRLGDEVERLGGVLGEHDLAGVRRPDEPGDLGAGALEGGGGLLGDEVGAAVHVGVRLLVVALHGVEHGLRLLRRVGRVEVDEAAAVHLALEEREVLADRGDVERHRSNAS